MSVSETSEGQTTFSRIAAGALPLSGVFLAGLAVSSGMWQALLRSTVGDQLPETLVAFSGFSLPLAVYATLHAAGMARGRTGNTAGTAGSVYIITCLLLFIVTLAGFHFLLMLIIEILMHTTFIFLVLLVPPGVGMVYGAFLSFMSGLLRGERAHRPRANMWGGATVGVLIFVLYLRTLPAISAIQGDWSFADALWSAVVLTLCYLPHLLATRPWRPESRRTAQA